MAEYERVLAGDIHPGDRVARARTHDFREVKAIRHGPVAVTLVYDVRVDGMGRKYEVFDRPSKWAKWWKEVG